jgi:hypothetical protein
MRLFSVGSIAWQVQQSGAFVALQRGFGRKYSCEANQSFAYANCRQIRLTVDECEYGWRLGCRRCGVLSSVISASRAITVTVRFVGFSAYPANSGLCWNRDWNGQNGYRYFRCRIAMRSRKRSNLQHEPLFYHVAFKRSIPSTILRNKLRFNAEYLDTGLSTERSRVS